MVNIKTDTPKSKCKCVYVLMFPDGSFYIGSTSNFRGRLSGYRSAFKNSIGNVNKLVAKKWNEFKSATFQIVERVENSEDLRHKEDVYIKASVGNPLLLNRSKSAFNNSGMVKKR